MRAYVCVRCGLNEDVCACVNCVSIFYTLRTNAQYWHLFPHATCYFDMLEINSTQKYLHIHIYLHTHTYMQNMHTYIHTYIHTYMAQPPTHVYWYTWAHRTLPWRQRCRRWRRLRPHWHASPHPLCSPASYPLRIWPLQSPHVGICTQEADVVRGLRGVPWPMPPSKSIRPSCSGASKPCQRRCWRCAASCSRGVTHERAAASHVTTNTQHSIRLLSSIFERDGKTLGIWMLDLVSIFLFSDANSQVLGMLQGWWTSGHSDCDCYLISYVSRACSALRRVVSQPTYLCQVRDTLCSGSLSVFAYYTLLHHRFSDISCLFPLTNNFGELCWWEIGDVCSDQQQATWKRNCWSPRWISRPDLVSKSCLFKCASFKSPRPLCLG